MKLWTFNLYAVLLCLSTPAVFAAEAANESNFGNAEMQQQVEQGKDMPRHTHKHMHHKKAIRGCNMGWKDIDGNHDGKISKEEFMSYHEQKFEHMKQADGMIDVKEMRYPAKPVPMSDAPNNSSMNNKPLGTTNGNDAVNPKDAGNGKKY